MRSLRGGVTPLPRLNTWADADADADACRPQDRGYSYCTCSAPAGDGEVGEDRGFDTAELASFTVISQSVLEPTPLIPEDYECCFA